MDKVLDTYKNLTIAVSAVTYDAAVYGVRLNRLDDIYGALDKLAALYGMDLELAATAFKEHNDLAAHADKLKGGRPGAYPHRRHPQHRPGGDWFLYLRCRPEPAYAGSNRGHARHCPGPL